MNTYFVSAVDKQTGLVVLMREIQAPGFSEAASEACFLAVEKNHGKPIRLTSVVEQPVPKNSAKLFGTLFLFGDLTVGGAAARENPSPSPGCGPARRHAFT